MAEYTLKGSLYTTHTGDVCRNEKGEVEEGEDYIGSRDGVVENKKCFSVADQP